MKKFNGIKNLIHLIIIVLLVVIIAMLLIHFLKNNVYENFIISWNEANKLKNKNPDPKPNASVKSSNCNACEKKINNECLIDRSKKKNNHYHDFNGVCRVMCGGPCKRWDGNICKDLSNEQDCKTYTDYLKSLPSGAD